jgi:hypothetical protein
MTTSLARKTKIKFTGLSSLATDLLRKRARYQQETGELKVGRTVFTFLGESDDLKALLDFLITQEIPFAGASSKEVKRLRELRLMLRAATDPQASPEDAELAGHVTITRPNDTRDHVLNLLNVLWEAYCDHSAAHELADLAEADGGPHVDYRAWLGSVL